MTGGRNMSTNYDIEINLGSIKHLTSEQKQDIEIMKKVESCLKIEASGYADQAREAYEFGGSKGLSIEKWELSEAEQFKALYEEYFPNNEEENKAINNFLLDRYCEYPGIMSELGKEKDILKEELVKYQYINDNKHDIIDQFEQNYKKFENIQKKYAFFFEKLKTYEDSPENSYEANYLIEELRGEGSLFYLKQMKNVEDGIGNIIKEKTELSNLLIPKLKELQDRKFLFFHSVKNRSEIKDTKNQIQVLKDEIEKNKKELEQFKKEREGFLSEEKIIDDFQYTDEINHILYDELLYAISDETLEGRKERFEDAIDRRVNEIPNTIKERISEIESLMNHRNKISFETQKDAEETEHSIEKDNDVYQYKTNCLKVDIELEGGDDLSELLDNEERFSIDNIKGFHSLIINVKENGEPLLKNLVVETEKIEDGAGNGKSLSEVVLEEAKEQGADEKIIEKLSEEIEHEILTETMKF